MFTKLESLKHLHNVIAAIIVCLLQVLQDAIFNSGLAVRRLFIFYYFQGYECFGLVVVGSYDLTEGTSPHLV